MDCTSSLAGERPSASCAQEYDAYLTCVSALATCPIDGICPLEYSALGACERLHPLPDAGSFDAASDGGHDAAQDGGPAAPIDAFLPLVDAWEPDAGPISHAIRCLSSTHVFVPHTASFEPYVPVTLELWVRPRGPGVIAAIGDPDSTARLVMRLSSADASYLELASSVGTIAGVSGFTLHFDTGASLVGAWHHLALVFDQSVDGSMQMRFYLDGNEAWPGTMPAGDVSTYMEVARSSDFRFCSLDGDMDDVRLWRVARTQAEIQANMRAVIAPGDPDLAAYYSLDEAGQVVLDNSGHGATGALGDTFAVESTDPVRIPDNAF
jgi:hypothetical protein